MLSPADRQAFSLQIVSADQQIAGLTSASAQINIQLIKDQALDLANDHLFTPINTLINQYQAEFNLIDGQIRTSITEQNILDSANRVIGNFFFPNNTALSIPVLGGLNNVWIQTNPFALAYGIGQQYNQTYGSGIAETGLISTIQGYITSTGGNTDIINTSGQFCNDMDTCSIPLYDGDMSGCVSHSGTFYSTDTIVPYPPVQTLSTNIIAAVNGLVTQVTAEAAALTAIIDSEPTRTSQNTTALNYINSTLLPALNLWLSYPAFQTVPGSVTTCAAFNSYDSNLLAPTQLHSTQLSVLQSVLNARSTFLSGTRVSQLNTNLGTVTQNITNGVFSGSGFYLTRFIYMNLRLNLLSGSLISVVNDQQSIGAQTQMISNLKSQVSVYESICPTTLLSSSGNGTPIISVVDISAFSAGQTVYIMSSSQIELQFAIKSINGNSIQLSSPLPTKYTTLDQVRFYRDTT